MLSALTVVGRRFAALSLVMIFFTGCVAVDDKEYQACLVTFTATGVGAGSLGGVGGAALGGAAAGSAAALGLCREAEPSPYVTSLEPPPIPRSATRATVSDADGDGVDDGDDRCADTPAGVEVDELGCAKPLVFDSRILNFAFDSATLPSDAKRVLQPAVRFMQQHPQIAFLVVGHTDSKGSDDYNDALSLARARAVRGALVAEGVAAAKLQVRGEGERMPVATNETAAGQARNRRVEVSLKP